MPYVPEDIITITPGNYTPGAESSLNAMADVINAAWNKAGEKAYNYDQKMTNATSSWLDTVNAPEMTPASAAMLEATEPTITIADAPYSQILNTYDSKYQELIDALVAEFTAFRATYFPTEQTLYNELQTWLDAALDGGRAMPTAIYDQMISDARDKITEDALRATDEATAAWAARGFSLPPGALTYSVIGIQKKSQAEMAAAVRAAELKDFELSYDKVKFAVDKALSLRNMALSSAVEYVKALASGPDIASRIVNIGYDAQSKMVSAAAQFYNARIEAKKMQSLINHGNAERAQDANKANLQSELQLIEDKLKALLSEAQALAQMATSLYNNVHASAGTAYSVSGT